MLVKTGGEDNMKRLLLTASFALATLIGAAGHSFAQSYPVRPYDYKPGTAGKMGIGVGGREAYHPDYYSGAPGYGYGLYGGYGGYGYGPANNSPNTTGLPSQPMAAPDSSANDSYRSRYYTSSPSHPNAAAIDVKVPAKAKLWFQGRETQQKGADRFFESPPLEQGKSYAYQVKAVWTNEKGEKVERTRTVQVRSGAYVALDLRKPQS
jgi:uncharacterized protein (TIGR03000 family)